MRKTEAVNVNCIVFYSIWNIVYKHNYLCSILSQTNKSELENINKWLRYKKTMAWFNKICKVKTSTSNKPENWSEMEKIEAKYSKSNKQRDTT